MYLSELNQIINGKIYGDVLINKIKTNSKDIELGDTFLAINKGHDYIEEAIDKGAVAIISETVIKDIPCIKVESSIIALGEIAHYLRNK